LKTFGWNVDSDEGFPRIVIAYDRVESTLEGRLASPNPLNRIEQRIIIHSIASALGVMHSHKCAHRFVIAASVFFTRDGAVLGEFLKSKNMSGMQHSEMATQNGYEAPELIDKKYTRTIDIWDFGWLIWEILHSRQRPDPRPDTQKDLEWDLENRCFHGFVSSMRNEERHHRPKIRQVIEWVENDKNWPVETYLPFRKHLNDKTGLGPSSLSEDDGKALDQFLRMLLNVDDVVPVLGEEADSPPESLLATMVSLVLQHATGLALPEQSPWVALGRIVKECWTADGFNRDVIRQRLDELPNADLPRAGDGEEMVT
jgi:serine/threonine protein kinase